MYSNQHIYNKKLTFIICLSTETEVTLTGAVLGHDGVSIVTGGADVAVRAGRVVHAAQTLPGERVAVGEQHVRVGVAVAVARLAPAAQHHGVAVVTGGTSVCKRERADANGYAGYDWCLGFFFKSSLKYV